MARRCNRVPYCILEQEIEKQNCCDFRRKDFGVGRQTIGRVTLKTTNLDDKLFDFVYTMTFRDATMRKALARKTNESDSGFHNRKMEVKREARDIVKAYTDAIIDEQLEGSNPEKTIIEVCERTGDYGMTFGNSQKLVNMTAKYMFMCAYTNKDMRARFRKCHCPMDGAMNDFLRERFTNYPELNGFKESEEFKVFKKMGSDWSWS